MPLMQTFDFIERLWGDGVCPCGGTQALRSDRACLGSAHEDHSPREQPFHADRVGWQLSGSTANEGSWRRIQPVNATHSLNLSAGVWKPSVLRGLSFNCLAIVLSFA